MIVNSIPTLWGFPKSIHSDLDENSVSLDSHGGRMTRMTMKRKPIRIPGFDQAPLISSTPILWSKCPTIWNSPPSIERFLDLFNKFEYEWGMRLPQLYYRKKKKTTVNNHI